ncbi:hypothetical protein C0J52_04460 [Blattella germanica]|nr:hypothetical protein C0J52_04460 [Blattella germanica]
MILNAYAAIRKDFPSYTIDQCVTKTVKMLFVSKATVYRIKTDQELGPNSSTSLLSTPRKKKPALSCAKTLELDHFDLEAIRRIIHTDFFKEKSTSYKLRSQNRTFKIADMRILLEGGIWEITVDIAHVLQEEQRLWEKDELSDSMTVPPIVIYIGDISTTEEEEEEDKDMGVQPLRSNSD